MSRWTIQYQSGGDWVALPQAKFVSVMEELSSQEEFTFNLPNTPANRSFVDPSTTRQTVRVLWDSTVVYSGLLCAVGYSLEKLECVVYHPIYVKLLHGYHDTGISGTGNTIDLYNGTCDDAGISRGSCPSVDKTQSGTGYSSFGMVLRWTQCDKVMDYLRNCLGAERWYTSTTVNIGTRDTTVYPCGLLKLGTVRKVDWAMQAIRAEVAGVVTSYNLEFSGQIYTYYDQEKGEATGSIGNNTITRPTAFGFTDSGTLNTEATNLLAETDALDSTVTLVVPTVNAIPWHPGNYLTVDKDFLALNGNYEIINITKGPDVTNVDVDVPSKQVITMVKKMHRRIF